MNNKICVLMGLSASGKDSQCDLIKKHLGYNFVVSHTTRPMRPKESYGNPYWFVSEEDFENTPMIERREYNTLVDNKPAVWKYGVAKNAIKDDVPYVVVLDYQGYQEFVSHFGDRVFGVFLDVDECTRRQRCIHRGDFDVVEWNRREIADKKSFEGCKEACDAVLMSYDSNLLYENISKLLREVNE